MNTMKKRTLTSTTNQSNKGKQCQVIADTVQMVIYPPVEYRPSPPPTNKLRSIITVTKPLVRKSPTFPPVVKLMQMTITQNVVVKTKVEEQGERKIRNQPMEFLILLYDQINKIINRITFSNIFYVNFFFIFSFSFFKAKELSEHSVLQAYRFAYSNAIFNTIILIVLKIILYKFSIVKYKPLSYKTFTLQIQCILSGVIKLYLCNTA